MQNKQNVIIGGVSLLVMLGLHHYFCKPKQTGNLTDTDVNDINGDNILVSKQTVYDLTETITTETTVYPGDPSFEKEQVCTIGHDCHFGLSKMSMSNHMGTHIDFPAHVVEGGKTSNDYSIDQLINDGLIIEVPNHFSSISAKFIRQQTIFPDAFVFFKTQNSNIKKTGQYRDDYVFIEPSAAQALLEKKVKVVGVDYLSIDGPEEETLPVHKLLLSNEVLIVEGLNLKGIEPGQCKIHIAPLKIDNMDGLPARVTAFK